MKNSYGLALIALVMALVGMSIALAAYFRRKNCILCDDLDDDFIEYYDDEDEALEDCCGGCGCSGNGEAEAEE